MIQILKEEMGRPRLLKSKIDSRQSFLTRSRIFDSHFYRNGIIYFYYSLKTVGFTKNLKKILNHLF